jgi:glutathione S-transferase
MKLYYCETLNPRKACAAARHVNADVEFIHVDIGRGEQRTPQFLAMNPNARLPVLQDGDWTLWESNAIMCHLSDATHADLWPHDSRQVEVMRWLSWDSQHFTRHGGELYFQLLIRPKFNLGPADPAAVEEAMAQFRSSARVLDDHLRDRDYLVGEALSVADFAVGGALPYAEGARLPLDEFPNVRRWYARLNELPAWREPYPRAN